MTSKVGHGKKSFKLKYAGKLKDHGATSEKRLGVVRVLEMSVPSGMKYRETLQRFDKRNVPVSSVSKSRSEMPTHARVIGVNGVDEAVLVHRNEGSSPSFRAARDEDMMFGTRTSDWEGEIIFVDKNFFEARLMPFGGKDATEIVKTFPLESVPTELINRIREGATMRWIEFRSPIRDPISLLEFDLAPGMSTAPAGKTTSLSERIARSPHAYKSPSST